MSARSTFKLSDEVRDILARSTITATTVQLPDGQLERKLYEQVNKALEGAGGKWNRSKKVHVFERDPRELLGLAVETGKATNLRNVLQAFYTPIPLAERMVAAAEIALVSLPDQLYVLEPSIGEGALAAAAASQWATKCRLNIVGCDIDSVAVEKAVLAIQGKPASPTATSRRCALTIESGRDFLTVEPNPYFHVVLMNPPFTGGADIAHVTHAWNFVRPGGVLVAVMSPGWQTANTKAAVAFQKLLATAVRPETENIPRGTFEHTDVATVMIVMRKPSSLKKNQS